MHNPAIARFFAVDPMFKEYPYYSPYAFSGNRVLDAIELEGLQPGKLFDSADQAALNFSQLFNDNSIRENKEYGTRIYKQTANGVEKYSYTIPVVGTLSSINVSDLESIPPPNGTTVVAYAHTHGASSANAVRKYKDNQFSGTEGSTEDEGDIGYAEKKSIDAYVATPNGAFKKYSYVDDIVTIFVNHTGVAEDTGSETGGGGIAPKSTSSYTFKNGDTLTEIAEKYHTTSFSIILENEIYDSSKLKEGDVLNITN